MNEERFKQFSQAYRDGLEASVRACPDQYFTDGLDPIEYAEIVSARMLQAIASGQHRMVNYQGGGFRRACKMLGIKATRQAIFGYLEID